MNHCLLEVEVLEAPQLRYTQDNQTPIAEMTVRLDGLRPDDPPGQLKVVGWGNLAQDLQQRVQVGQRFVLEGRMRMNTVSRPDGLKEKRAELTLARLHPLGAEAAPHAEPAPAGPAGGTPAAGRSPTPAPVRGGRAAAPAVAEAAAAPAGPPVWNTSPLVPDDGIVGDDDIPF
ncbi:MAG: single-stranded DNA-binding protein [Cyanobium sp.]